MAIAEMEFDPSKRDLLTLGFARKRGGGQPPRRPTSRTQPNQPRPDGGFKFTRREALIAGTIVAGSTAATVLLKPWEWINSQPEQQFVVPELKRLGNELANWQIDGTKISDVFPEAKKAADLLTGKIDPRSFIPVIKLPILFDPNYSDAAFNLSLPEDSSDSRDLLVTLPSGQAHLLKWISHQSEATIRLSPEIRASTIRSAILTKEVSQLYDMYDYCQLYLSLVRKAGVRVDIINPDNLPFSELERVIVTAHQIRILEERIYQQPSFFRTIVDSGSGLKIGGIMFANWLLDQLNHKIPIPNREQTQWINTGYNLAGFLQEKRLIYQQQRGDLFQWSRGKSPEINSAEFLQFTEEFTNTKASVFQ